MTQKQKVLQHLKTKGSITSADAIVNYWITRLAEYIRQLRSEGEKITSVWEYGEDRKKWVRYHYSLRKKRAPGVNVNKAATK
jgi:hypothetical protein